MCCLPVQIVSTEYLYYTAAADVPGPEANSHVKSVPVHGVFALGPWSTESRFYWRLDLPPSFL